MLNGLRALDLTDEKGFLCGKILGDLGVDVLKIEPHGGDPARYIGPFYGGVRNPEKSLYWFMYNSSKRGITLNIEETAGQRIFKKLLKTADFVIESFPIGYMDKLGLGYVDLNKINSRIIHTSITPFGQTGPYRDYKASDLIVMAMSGLMHVTGDSDRPPLRPGFDQAYALTGLNAAVGTLFAHHYRQFSDEGQFVDVSMYECVVRANYRDPGRWQLNKEVARRSGNCIIRGRVINRLAWPCQDGYICWSFMTGEWAAKANRTFVQWMDEEGKAGTLKQIEWEKVDQSQMTQQQVDYYEEHFGRFFLAHTVEELEKESMKRGLSMVRVANIEQVAKNEQLAARHYWRRIEHAELGTDITYPGNFFVASGCGIRFRAPLIGEHNEQVYKKELGLSNEEISDLRRSDVI